LLILAFSFLPLHFPFKFPGTPPGLYHTERGAWPEGCASVRGVGKLRLRTPRCDLMSHRRARSVSTLWSLAGRRRNVVT
jgi:hypothetical protein